MKTKFKKRRGNVERIFIRFSWPTLWHWIPTRILGQQEEKLFPRRTEKVTLFGK